MLFSDGRKTYLIGYLVERRIRTGRSVEFTDSALSLEEHHYLYSRVSNVSFSFRPFFFILRSRTRRFNRNTVRNPCGACNVYLLFFSSSSSFYSVDLSHIATAVYLLPWKEIYHIEKYSIEYQKNKKIKRKENILLK